MMQEWLASSVSELDSSLVSLPPGFVRDLVVEQVGTDISNKTAAMNLAVATALSDRILDEVTDALGIASDQLVSKQRGTYRFIATLLTDGVGLVVEY